MVCKRCKKSNNDDAKYCQNCGKLLDVDDSKNIKLLFIEITNKIIDLCKGISTRPVDTIKKFTKIDNFNLSIVLIVILSFCVSLFGLAFLKNTYSSFIGNNYYTYGFVAYKIPYFRTFYTLLFTVILLSFAYAGIMHIVNTMIFKRQSDFKEAYSMNAACSVVVSVGLIISSILLFINVYLGITLCIFSVMLNMIYTYHGLIFLGIKEENKCGYIYLLTHSLFYIILLTIIKLFS